MPDSKKTKTLLIYNADQTHERLCRQYDDVFYFEGSLTNGHKLAGDFISGFDLFSSDIEAGKKIEEVFDFYFSEDEISLYKDLLGHSNSALCLKKDLILHLKEITLMIIFVKKFREKYGCDHVELVPAQNFPYRLYTLLAGKQSMPKWFHIAPSCVSRLKREARGNQLKYLAAALVYPLYVIFKMTMAKASRKQNFYYAINIWGTFPKSVCERFIDKLKVDETIKDEESLFVVNTKINEPQLNALKVKYKNCYTLDELLNQCNVFRYLGGLLHRLFALNLRLLSLKNKNIIFLLSYIKTLRQKILWFSFFEQYSVNHFLYVQEPGSSNSIMIQQLNGSHNSFLYLSTSFFPFSDKVLADLYITYYSYLPHNVLLSNRLSQRLFEANQDAFGKKVDVGTVTSSFVKELSSIKEARHKLRQQLNIPENKKIICLCDAPMGRFSWTDEAQSARRLEDIAQLIDANDDYFLIYKMKSSFDKYAEGSPISLAVKKLKHMERVICIDKKTSAYTTQEIMAVSDLVISFFTSSAGFEAISGGVKAIYYAPEEYYHSLDIWIKDIPHLSAFSRDELFDCVAFWLREEVDEEFVAFKENYIKRIVDPFCDEKSGLNRVISFLSDEKTIDASRDSVSEKVCV